MTEIEHGVQGVPRMRKGERVRYVPNRRSFGAFIKSERMRGVTADVAEDIAALAKQLSPTSTRGGDQDGKRMKDQFRVIREAGFMKVGGNIRVMVRIQNDARSAAANEFGTRKNKAHRMLGRAGARFGDFKPEPAPVEGQRGRGGATGGGE